MTFALHGSALQKRAVIDIGSNSVRLVIYGGPVRANVAIFNEKVLCKLGALDPETGGLREAAMERALHVLQRFNCLLHYSGNPPVEVFATAATRDAYNGPDFIKRIKKIGFNPRVLSGKEEARYAAYGVLSGISDVIQPKDKKRPNLCGDLGGGSLELARYTTDQAKPISDRASLPIGVLRLQSQFDSDIEAARKYIRARLKKINWIGDIKTDRLYVVGGTWRAIAQMDMVRRDCRFKALHHHIMRRSQALDICELVERASPKSLNNMANIQRSRVPTLPYAALVMNELLRVTNARKVVVSSCGVREGIMYDAMPAEVKHKDPFVLLAAEYAQRYCPDPSYGEQAFNVLEGLFLKEKKYFRRIRLAACLMADSGGLHHPDNRAVVASDLALHAPFIDIDHAGRIALAAILYQRYHAKPTDFISRYPNIYFSESLQNHIHRTGLALRFLSDFMPKTSEGLQNCRFTLTKSKLIFSGPEQLSCVVGEVPQKRLVQLANCFDVTPEVNFSCS